MGFNGSVGQSIQYAEIGRVSRVKWGYWYRVYTGYGKDPTLFESIFGENSNILLSVA